MNNDLQDWGLAYQEIATLITTKVPTIKHVDLYWGQDQAVDEDGNWLPFPAPAVFLDFNALSIEDLAEGRQLITMDVGVKLYRETLSDTHKGSGNQAAALAFIGLMRQLHAALHGAKGTHFGPMSRVALSRVDTQAYVQMYDQVYRTVMLDYGATATYQEEDAPPLELPQTPPAAAPAPDPQPLFRIPAP
ncbi:MAG: hypothetical protein JNL05_10500 [Flavobacteriales bacterium]|nr:hypothetical protein [Flavobacteriales bacterium]